jgi:hypothetical protein
MLLITHQLITKNYLMSDQKPITPKPEIAPVPKEMIENAPAEKESAAAIEKRAEAESKKEEELIDQLAQLRAQMAAKQATAAASTKQAQLDSDIEQRKKRIIDGFVKAVRASNFDEKEVAHAMHVAERYIRKDYPDIADEIHDRITNERNQQTRN